MARRRKRLVDLVRDGTFLARKDEYLLNSKEVLAWPELERYRRAFRAAVDDEQRREVSLLLQHALREPDAPTLLLGDLQQELLALGPAGSFEQLQAFFPRFFRHYAGPRAGEPFVLERYQCDFLREFWRRDKDGRRVYSVGLLGIPKGNGKTPLAAGLGTYALVSNTDAPEVYNVAGAKDQAALCYEFASRNIQEGALAAWLDAGAVIGYPETHGEYEILSSDGDMSAGVNPTAAVVDEWWLYKHRKQREAYNSLHKALPKRSGQSWLLAITTAGYDKTTQLGETYDDAVEHPLLELHDDGALMIVRDEASGFLFWWYGAPEGSDLENPEVLRACNPAPWVNPTDLLKELRQPGSDELDWQRLHCNVWTKTRSSWLASGIWAGLRSSTQIPEGAEITVGIDAARTFDTTAIAWCWIAPDGRKVLASHVWSVRPQAPHHQFVAGGELVNEELVEPYVHELARRFQIRAIAFDPRYFSAEARHLANTGLQVIEVQPQSREMGDAVVLFEKEARSQMLSHDGDRVLHDHVEAIDAIRRPDGSKKIGQRADANPIDAGVACILANYLTVIDLPTKVVLEPFGGGW